MAKKAAKAKTVEETPNSEVTVKAITKDYGSGVIKRASDVLEELNELKVLSWSPILDGLLNGGIREGTIVGLVADEKMGKTTSLLHFVAKNQKRHPEKMYIYVNTEGRVNSDNLKGVKDLDLDNLIIIESTKEKKLSGDDFLDIIERYMNLHPGSVIIIDSLSNLIPKEELEGKINSSKRDKLPRLLSVFFKRCSSIVANNKIILFCVAHYIADTGPSRRTKAVDCGKMFRYQVGTFLEIAYKENWDESEKPVGQKMKWQIITSNNGAKPRSSDFGWLKYGTGIDEIQETIITASEFGIIQVSGSWYKIPCILGHLDNKAVQSVLEEAGLDESSKEEDILKAFQKQGSSKLNTFLEENPGILELIQEEVCKINSMV